MSSIDRFMSERATDLKKHPECKGRIPDQYLISIKFKDGHFHHLLPSEKIVEEFIEDVISTENLPFKHEKNIHKEIERKPIIFKNRQAIGDILMFTCAIRDMKKAFPDWPISAWSTAMHIWDNNPWIDRSLNESNAEVVEIGPGWLTNASNGDDRHFANAFRISIQDKLGIEFSQGPIKPDIWMSIEEVKARPIIEPPYWIVVAGEKGDWTAKTYPFTRWQNIILNLEDELPNMKFVQIGAKEHKHPALSGKNIINLIGKTQDKETGIRDLFNLFYHAEGSMGLVSFQMHLAAAFNMPCIVIAGAREPARFTRYPGHQYLCTDGCLPCAIDRACWHCDLDKTCKYLIEIDGKNYPQCVDIITEEDVLRAFWQYYEGGRLSKEHPRRPTLPNPIVQLEDMYKHSIKTVKSEVICVEKKEAEEVKQDLPNDLWGFEWGGGSITDRDWAFVKAAIKKYNIKSILEFGAGLSTLLMNDLRKEIPDLKIITYETQPSWITKIQSKNLECNIKQWDGKQIYGLEDYDFAFVDGPAGGINREFSTKLASEHAKFIIVHDAGREWERKWQDKYLKDKFKMISKGGHRCHFWGYDQEIEEENKNVIELLANSPKKLFRMVFNGRGDGGAEHSTTWIMNELLKKGWTVEYIYPGNKPSGTFAREGSQHILKHNNLDAISSPCDILMLYTNDWVWEFDKDAVVTKFERLEAKRKVMAINYRLGNIGKLEWAQDWDLYLFLNNSIEEDFLAQYFKSKGSQSTFIINTKILAPPTDLTKFFENSPIYNGKLNLIRHSSQGDTKYPKNFNDILSELRTKISEVEIHLMPAPSFLDSSFNIENGGFVHTYKRNNPPPADFLKMGNCFWYILPEGYHDMGPKVIMEAQASGLPVIADNHSGAKSRITHGVDGYLCDGIDDHIKSMRLLSNEYSRKIMGGDARKKAKKEYNPENWIKEIIGE